MSGDARECSIPFSSPQRSLVCCTQVGQCTCAQQEAMAGFGCRHTGFETYMCLCVALSFQVTCFLALGFVLLFFFSRWTVLRIDKMLFITRIMPFLARRRWGLNPCFHPFFGLVNQSDLTYSFLDPRQHGKAGLCCPRMNCQTQERPWIVFLFPHFRQNPDVS